MSVAQIVQQAVKPLGITVKIRTIDVNQLFTTQGKGDYQMSIDYWTMDIPDPDENTELFLNGEGDGLCYYTRYNNPTMNKMVTDAAKEFDSGQARAALHADPAAGGGGHPPAVPVLLPLPLLRTPPRCRASSSRPWATCTSRTCG